MMTQAQTSQGRSALKPPLVANPPRVLIIGAGSRGNAYAQAVCDSAHGIVAAVAEPIAIKRRLLGSKSIWGAETSLAEQEFDDWQSFLLYERSRRGKAKSGEKVPVGVDAVIICTLDETHAEIILALAPLKLHIMSEKPLATTLNDCISIHRALSPKECPDGPPSIFAIGHVLRYSPHNMLLRKLLLEDEVIGDIISMEHTEPVGWWHYAHSYGQLAQGVSDCTLPPDEVVSRLGSTALAAERAAAGFAVGASSAVDHNIDRFPRAFQEVHEAGLGWTGYELLLIRDDYGFPVRVVVPEIEDLLRSKGRDAVESVLEERLTEDYDDETPRKETRPWFGRCVYEADNDVCDDQFVTITWDEETADGKPLAGRGQKTATFHMVAFTEAVCERRSRIYGSKGEIEADSKTIKVYDFASGQRQIHYPPQAGGGHGGGDDGLARQYISAINAVKNQGMSVADAQRQFIGCTLEDVVRSHALVFAAEEARKERKVVDWSEWWERSVKRRFDAE